MNVAVVNGQRVPVEAGGVRGFLSEATQGLNPVKINEALQAAFWHPLDTAKGLLAAQDVPRQEAMTRLPAGRSAHRHAEIDRLADSRARPAAR